MEDKQARILRAIAVAMKTEAKRNGRNQYERAGLTLWLQFEDGVWTLAISRQTSIVDAERHRIAKAFKVPDISRHKTTQKESWHRVWYQWSEPVKLSQVELPGELTRESYNEAA